MAQPAQTPRATLPPGLRVLGEYILERPIERTETWVTYVGWHAERERDRYHVRVLRRDTASRPQLVEAFARQAQVLESLDHRGIVKLAATGVDQGVPLIITPAVEGTTLEARLAAAKSGLEPAEVARIVGEVADVLAYLHARTPPIVHRGLSPARVLLAEPRGEVKVLEVSYAHALALATPDGVVPSPAPLPYRAPEDLGPGDGAAAPAIDQFALASLAFECLTGRPAFDGGDEAAVASAIARGPRPRVASARAGLPAGLDAVLHRAWSVDPAARYPDVKAFARELARALGAARDAANEFADVPTRVSATAHVPVAPPAPDLAPPTARPASARALPEAPAVGATAELIDAVFDGLAAGRAPVPATNPPTVSAAGTSSSTGGAAASPREAAQPAAPIVQPPRPDSAATTPPVAATAKVAAPPAASSAKGPSPTTATATAKAPPAQPAAIASRAAAPTTDRAGEQTTAPRPVARPVAPPPPPPPRTAPGASASSALTASGIKPAPEAGGTRRPADSTARRVDDVPTREIAAPPPRPIAEPRVRLPTPAYGKPATSPPEIPASAVGSAVPRPGAPRPPLPTPLASSKATLPGGALAVKPLAAPAPTGVEPAPSSSAPAAGAPPARAELATVSPPLAPAVEPAGSTSAAPRGALAPAVAPAQAARSAAPHGSPPDADASPRHAPSPDESGPNVSLGELSDLVPDAIAPSAPGASGASADASGVEPIAIPGPVHRLRVPTPIEPITAVRGSLPEIAPAASPAPAAPFAPALDAPAPAPALATALPTAPPASQARPSVPPTARRASPQDPTERLAAIDAGSLSRRSPAVVTAWVLGVAMIVGASAFTGTVIVEQHALARAAQPPTISAQQPPPSSSPSAAPAPAAANPPAAAAPLPVHTPEASGPTHDAGAAPEPLAVAPSRPAAASPAAPESAPAAPDGPLPDHPRGRAFVAARRAIAERITACSQEGVRHHRHARIAVTYDGATGRAREVTIRGNYFTGQPVGACVERAVRDVNVGRFQSPTWDTDMVFMVR